MVSIYERIGVYMNYKRWAEKISGDVSAVDSIDGIKDTLVDYVSRVSEQVGCDMKLVEEMFVDRIINAFNDTFGLEQDLENLDTDYDGGENSKNKRRNTVNKCERLLGELKGVEKKLTDTNPVSEAEITVGSQVMFKKGRFEGILGLVAAEQSDGNYSVLVGRALVTNIEPSEISPVEVSNPGAQKVDQKPKDMTAGKPEIQL